MPPKKNFSESAVINKYKELKSLRKVADSFEVSIGPIRRILKENNIQFNNSRKYCCNQNFFKIIETQEQAYFLGFLYADGSVRDTKNRAEIKLKLHYRDKYIIENFNKVIEGNYPIKSEKNTNCYKIDIGSRTMARDLIKKGCVPRKSLVLKFPGINEELLNHFIRGYFDGNGCISINKHGYPVVNFVGSKPFITILKKKLICLCGLPDTQVRPSGKAYELAYHGIPQLLRIRNFLYKDAKESLYLYRKREKFDLLDKSKPFLNKIFNGDCLDILSFMPSNFVDLVVTSPPYNTNMAYDSYKDKKTYRSYLYWLRKIFQQIYRCLKPGGRCVIVIGDQKNGRIATHTDVIDFMINKLKYLLMSTIVWNKENVSNRASWGSFASPKEPSFPTPFEYVLVFAKKSRKILGKGETDITKEEFIKWAYALWTFERIDYKDSSRTINNKIHPAAFPEHLVERCIKMFSWKGAVILDPFLGSGTTAVVAKKLEREYIGIELSSFYCKMAERRVKNTIISYKFDFSDTEKNTEKKIKKNKLKSYKLFEDGAI